MTATIFAADSARSLDDVERTAIAVAGVLNGRGVSAGTRVLLKAGNSAGYVTALFALMHAGASIVLVDQQEVAAETNRICQVAGVALAVVDDDAVAPDTTPTAFIYELLAAAAGAGDRTDSRGDLDVDQRGDDRDGAGQGASRLRLETWLALPDGLIMWSSGSTGTPKGVVKTGARFIRNLERNAVHMGHRRDDVLLPLLPFSHQYGLSMVLIAWIVRCSLVIAPYRRVDRALRMAGQTGATVIDATPATYRTIWNLVNRRPASMADLTAVRMFCSGAAPLGPSLVAQYVELFGQPLLDSYGSTELGNITFATLDNPGGTGRPVAGIGVRVVDEADNRLGAGELGEIVVDSPDMMEGYLEPDGTVAPARRGWRRTGDLGHLDEQGNLFVHGRKLAVHRLGHTLHPEVIESRLAALGCTTKIIALPDSRRGCSLVFFVEDETGSPAARWRERICAALPAYEQPNRVVVIDRFPLNRNGKPDRHELQRMAAEPGPQPDTTEPADLAGLVDVADPAAVDA
ncbi:class I adenylate-forming enzyme family protein [Parafrankia discariae]|uniref:class I adenylate-forming enzyme family protein n=1 Tax=Parafrankia discariae TaxID=365528 RepID=UPI0003827FD8|nr:class I adenylate-forming enzyme family protein [Parafrankia discariae]